MWLYDFLDIISTISEAFVLLVVAECFCHEPRFQRNISRILLIVAFVAGVMWLTFFTDLGALKSFAALAGTVALVKLCYRTSLHESIVIMELSYATMTMLPENVGTSLMSFIYSGNITNTIGGVPVLKWEVYVFTILFRCICLAVIYRLLRDFRYHVQRKDAFVLTAGFLLAFGISFASLYGYLNLHEEDTLVLDLSASVLCVYFFVQFLYTKNVSYLREQEQRDKMQIAQLQQQFAYYQEKLRDEERVRSIYHDLKNHLLVLESGQNTEGTQQMAEKLRSEITSYEDYVHTGNEFLDIILKDKAAKARDRQIDFSALVDFNGIDFIEPLDISTIFGNAIDNAIEASEKLPEDKRLITVKAERVRDMLLITVENNVLPGTAARSETTKTDRFIHGFGLPNIKNAAGKYGGQCSIKSEDDKFTLKIIVPIP